MKTLSVAAVAVLFGVWSQTAFALDESVLSTARELGQQGLNAYDEGRYDEAAKKLLTAYGAVKVPTFARNAARALAKQGKLVVAAELYLEATRLEPSELWRGDLQQQAQHEAAQEREALLARIARLQIVIEGAAVKDLNVTIDGAPVPEALVGTEQFADPGVHHIAAKRAAQTVEQSIELKDGEHGQVVLRFDVAPAQQLQQPQQPAAQPAAPAPAEKSHLRRTMGWVGVGVGAAGITVGAVTGIVALVKRSKLHDSGCVDNDCYDQSARSNMDTYNSLLPVSTVGFIVGGVAAAAGVTLLLWPERRESKPNVGVWVGPSSLAVQGKF